MYVFEGSLKTKRAKVFLLTGTRGPWPVMSDLFQVVFGLDVFSFQRQPPHPIGRDGH
jgi:hypothetical protein